MTDSEQIHDVSLWVLEIPLVTGLDAERGPTVIELMAVAERWSREFSR
jgi:hypothetical protein